MIKHMWNRKEVAELLLTIGTEVNAKDIRGNTPLHLAAFKGCREVAGLLVAKGAEINAENGVSWTPLHAAVKIQDWPKELLSADPELLDETGKIAVAELLLANGAEVNAKGRDRKTPLKLTKSEAMKALLRKYGAK